MAASERVVLVVGEPGEQDGVGGGGVGEGLVDVAHLGDGGELGGGDAEGLEVRGGVVHQLPGGNVGGGEAGGGGACNGGEAEATTCYKRSNTIKLVTYGYDDTVPRSNMGRAVCNVVIKGVTIMYVTCV